MATHTEPRTRGSSNGNPANFDHWRDSTRVFLQPIAAQLSIHTSPPGARRP